MESGTKVVIVVEDDRSMSQAMERVLRLGGLAPVMFASAEDFLESVRENLAACMVIDVQLPGLNGIALRDRLARAGPMPPVIFITAFDNPEVRAQASRGGPCAFLSKPFSGTALLETVRGLSGIPAP
jgi:FixJ family two-component response regulator